MADVRTKGWSMTRAKHVLARKLKHSWMVHAQIDDMGRHTSQRTNSVKLDGVLQKDSFECGEAEVTFERGVAKIQTSP